MAKDPQHDVMQQYYELGKEAARLSSSGAGRPEFERTREIVLRHLPEPPATIADIGGGPGRYSLWLAGLGYRVVHRDLCRCTSTSSATRRQPSRPTPRARGLALFGRLSVTRGGWISAMPVSTRCYCSALCIT